MARSAGTPEMSTAKNEELVSRVYTQALQDRQDGRDLVVYHIEMLSQEVNGRIINVLATFHRKSRSGV
jgi:hypothetical protein